MEQTLKEKWPSQIRSGTIRFNGDLPRDELLRQLEEEDIFLMFSDYEGFPLSLLEAMSRGVVPVVTRLDSGVSEILKEDGNGRLFEVGDVHRCAQVIADLSENPEELTRLGQGAIESAKPYDVQATMVQFAAVLNDAVKS